MPRRDRAARPPAKATRSTPIDAADPVPVVPRAPAGAPKLLTAGDDAPPFAGLWATLLYVLAVMTLAYPALAGKFLVTTHSDQYIAGYAFREFAAQSLRAGDGFPLWNPYIFGGMPFVAAMHGDIFYPTFLLRMIAPTDVAMTWGFIIHVVLAGCFTYGFLRAWGMSFPAALVGGMAYMIGGNVAAHVSPGHDGKLFVSALFPMMCWMLLRGIRDGRAWAWGGLAIATGLAVLSPHPQLLQYALLASGSFALFLAFGLGPQALPRGIAIRRLGFALGAVILGGLIGAIQYVPVREYVSWSPRAGGIGSYETAVSYALWPEEMINFWLPHFSGILDAYWGRSGIHFHSEYMGAAVLVLVGIAIGLTANALNRRWMWFWIGVFTITLLWALGGSTPFYRLVYAVVPGTKFFRAPNTILYLVSFSLAMLAALGVERLRAVEVSRRRLIAIAGAAGVATLMALAGAFENIGETLVGPERYQAIADTTAIKLGAVRSLVFTLLALGIAVLSLRGRLRPKLLGWALAAVIAIDCWTVMRHYWQFMPGAKTSFASNAAIDYIRRDSVPGRVLVLPVSSEMGDHDPDFMGDGLMAHRVRQVRGYHGNELGRFTLIGNRADGYSHLYTPSFGRLYNVRYLMTNAPLPDQLQQMIGPMEQLVGPVKNAAGTSVYLFRAPGDNPAAWLAPVIVKADDAAVGQTVLHPRFDPRTAALFAPESDVDGKDITVIPAPLSIVPRVTKYEPGVIDVTLDQPAPAGSALIVSENFYPGWRASVDGRPAVTGRADYTLIGVPLPAGARSVSLRFTSPTYETGKLVTIIALAIAIVWLVAGALMSRKREVVVGVS